jgi:hypothetical protein
MYVRYLRILICIMTMSPLTRDAQNKREREKGMMDIICY